MFQPKHLADNIRRYRTLHGMTQAQLAAQLFITAQNVSKWEGGKSVPDLDNLCKLAKVFSVSTDRLLGNAEQTERGRLLIAVDGGGTKTEFVLYTEYGEVLERLVLGGSNPNAVGIANAQLVLRTGLDQLFAVNSDIAVIYAGIAGCWVKENRTKITSFLKTTYPGTRCVVASDIFNVIHGAPVEDRCIAVICGTGSVVYAKTPEDVYRIGGWGYLFESGFSGYDLGRDAIYAALAARDGVGPQTLLLELVEKRLGGNAWENINHFYGLHQDGIAAYAATVFEAYRRGDAVAEQILEKNSRQLALLINTATERYDCGTDVVIAGGLTAQEEILRKFLQQKVKKGLRLIFNQRPPICGAATGGCRTLGVLNPEFKGNFYKNYLKITEDKDNAENRNA